MNIWGSHAHLAPILEPFNIEEGPQYRPFCDLRYVTKAGRPWEHVENHRRACTWVFFLSKAELVLSSTAQKIPLAENRFLQALKRAENINEKSRRCFTCNLFVTWMHWYVQKEKESLKIGIDFPSPVATKLLHQRVVESKSLFRQQMQHSNTQTIDLRFNLKVSGRANACLCGLWEQDLLLLPTVGALLK